MGDFDAAFTLALLANKAVDAINVIPAQAGGCAEPCVCYSWASDPVGPGLLTADVVEPAIAYESGGLALPLALGSASPCRRLPWNAGRLESEKVAHADIRMTPTDAGVTDWT